MSLPEFFGNNSYSDRSSDEEPNIVDNSLSGTIIDLSIYYLLTKSYPLNADVKLKRSIRRRASTLNLEDGQIYIKKRKRRVKVIVSHEEQVKISNACHSEPTSGHFGVTKTRKKISERFYWKGMAKQIKELVSDLVVN